LFTVLRPEAADDLHQIVGSEEGSTRRYDDERIVGNDVRPLCRNRVKAAMAVLEVDPIFVPPLGGSRGGRIVARAADETDE
jgi:hypothetical protein